jgi:chemotaxis protein CheX
MEKFDQEKLIGIVCKATQDVFSTMLGMELTPQAAYVDRTTTPEPTQGVVALIGFAGSWVGTGMYTCSADMACKLSAAMLMCEYEAVNEEVLDAVAEVTNMVLGNVKTELEAELGPMGLSIPTVIFGRNFTTRSLGKQEWTVVPFLFEAERVEISLCLMPDRDRGADAVKPGFSRPFGVHV